MTAELAPVLPSAAPETWTKPTLDNTHHGKTYRPTHPDLFRVVFSQSTAEPSNNSTESSVDMQEGFTSKLVVLRGCEPHEQLTTLTNISLAPEKAYSSVQFGPGPRDHFELNSDLLLMNHSCAPTAYLVLPPNRPHEWRLHAGPGGLKKGDDVTFFYPSTEWDMAQGFDCACGAKQCLGKVLGAKHVTRAELEKRSYINEHIRLMKEEQDQGANETNGN